MQSPFETWLGLFFIVCLPIPSLGSPSWLSIAQSLEEQSGREFEEWVERGEFRKALQLAEKELSAARLAGDSVQEAWALNRLGDAFFYLGDRAKALEIFQEALAKRRVLGDLLGEATELKNVGIAYLNLDVYEEALDYLQEALELSRRLDVPHLISSSLENLGITYALLGAHRLALEIYEQTLELARQNRDEDQMHHLFVDMGYLYMDRNQPARAIEYFESALAIAEKLDHFLAQTYALEGISLANTASGDVTAALDSGQRFLRLSRRIKHEDGEAHGLWNLGYLHLELDLEIAWDYFQQAQAIWGRHEREVTWWQYSTLAQLSLRRDDPDLAIDYYQKAIDRVESFRSRIVTQQSRATFLGRHQDIYLEFIDLLMDQHGRNPQSGYDARAFHVFERSRARAMVEALVQSRADLSYDLEPDLQQREFQLRTRFMEVQKQLSNSNLAKVDRQELLRQLDQTELEFVLLIREIKRRNPHHAALRYPEPFTVQQTQELLDESEALLAYALTEKRIVAFVVTPRAFRVQELTTAPHLLAIRIRNYIDLISQGDDTGCRNIGRRLYLDLIAPLREHLSPQIQRLIIVPSGVLNYLPFETLIPTDPQSPQSSNRPGYLMEDFAISYSLSATTLAELDTSQVGLESHARAGLLVFADPKRSEALSTQRTAKRATSQTRALYEDEGLDFRSLPYTAEEARAIQRYAGEDSRVFTGADASEQRVKALPLNQYRVIHFATHGMISRRNPARSALLLAPGDDELEDGFLQAREIYRLKLACDLVVLSGCRTARGEILAGEGVQGLARSSFYAGAQTVLASLWDVNDKQTAEFMATFYGQLAGGQTKVEALRATKLRMLREKKSTKPRDWAPFILIGEPNGVIPLTSPWFSFPTGLWLPIAIILLAFGLTGLFITSLLKSRI